MTKIKNSHDLHLRLPAGYWQELLQHCDRTGESHSHVIRAALAEYLDIQHHTLWQVSTSTAVLEGVSDGCLRVSDLREHGDFGIGTFDRLDGEGILLNGQCWQARADGSLREVPDEELTPFFVVTHFHPDQTHQFLNLNGWQDLCDRLDSLRPTNNLFMAIRVQGVFEQIQLRTMSLSEQGENLLSAASHQVEFDHQNLSGTMVGFWSPSYASSLNIPGYHFHFVSDDLRHGGHVLDQSAVLSADVNVELQLESDLRLALPQTNAFMEADLSRDPTALLSVAEALSE